MEKDLYQLVLTENARRFIKNLPPQASRKIFYIIDRIRGGGEINNELFKKLKDSEIWEFRISHNRVSYRLLAFWDTEENTLIIVTHGIIKKTRKTPQKEILKAEKIRYEYFKEKKQRQ